MKPAAPRSQRWNHGAVRERDCPALTTLTVVAAHSLHSGMTFADFLFPQQVAITRRVTTATTPMAMPAMAPPPSPEEPPGGGGATTMVTLVTVVETVGSMLLTVTFRISPRSAALEAATALMPAETAATAFASEVGTWVVDVTSVLTSVLTSNPATSVSPAARRRRDASASQ